MSDDQKKPLQSQLWNIAIDPDSKIESISTQISHTQNFKKELLQQMFV